MELLQLILQQKKGDLSAADQKRIQTWVARDSLRTGAYHHFTELLGYRKKVETSDKNNIRIILEDLKKTYPQPFGSIQDNDSNYILTTSVENMLDRSMHNMASMVVFSFKWLTITILVVRLLIVLLGVWIIISMLQVTAADSLF